MKYYSYYIMIFNGYALFLSQYNNYFFPGIYCIRINLLDVPSAATTGTEVRLLCDYDLERQGLYQIKWYKGSHEFYRYSPGDMTKKKSFLVNNLNVDVSIINFKYF